MTLSTTLTPNSESIIGDALRSVLGHVDECMVIDTGITDRTLDIARDVAGDKLIVRNFPWTGSAADARNFALQCATELGAKWALTLDVDERLHLGPEVSPDSDVLLVPHESGSYTKERFIRLPTKGRWIGPCHECFVLPPGATKTTLRNSTFSELPKTPEQNRAKFERVIKSLTKYAREHPHDPRWFYYLGDAYAFLGKDFEAISAFDACSKLQGWNEESAWACYRHALIQFNRAIYSECIEQCAIGLSRHAGFAELAWLAGFAAYHRGDMDQAIYWSKLAIANGEYTNGPDLSRIGFKEPSALYEAPLNVLRFAYRSLGKSDEADRAEAHFILAKQRKEALYPATRPCAEGALAGPQGQPRRLEASPLGRLDQSSSPTPEVIN